MTNWPRPKCPYCGATTGLRIQHDGIGYMEPDYICEADYRGGDTGPCFDDLPPVAPDRWLRILLDAGEVAQAEALRREISRKETA